MLVTLPITELQPGMFVDSVSKQSGNSKVKIKSRGMVRDSGIIKQLKAKGVLELKIDFTQSEISIPDKYQPKPPTPIVELEPDKPLSKPDGTLSTAKKVVKKPVEPKSQKQQELVSLEKEFAQAIQQFEQHNRKVQTLYGDITAGMRVDMGLVNEVSKEIVESVFRNSNAMAIMTRLRDKDNYNWRHMINCTILVTVFAKYLGLKPAMVEQLALGAMLHDVGHAKLPQGILNKDSKLTFHEMKALEKHVSQSLGLVKGEAGLSKIVMDMIVNHHERLDGTGYPRGLKAENISKVARIMAIVDVYDAITADRPHASGNEPVHALRYLLTNKQLFDPELVQRFIKCMGVHPVGTIVKLTNERLALVLEGNRLQPTAPKVRIFYNTKHNHHITAKELDLSEPEHGVKIIAAVKPLDYQINLSRLLKDHLLV
ncbi:HD-GYP domain-containing protein [Pseudoalteromonas xiamenensis]|uniref:HD-GYP domain-containing protein n=1 Tax=Pseudoalteromonas xiamenensis TaxID=882626 RepID=UPI0027E573FE|nr:HD-GYP domain-containing protein [Pseudoalteromonas xiamenensis]WMN61100.1 HD-GYP domain-containing protein [Pseudoalteromonas xiamenensis]